MHSTVSNVGTQRPAQTLSARAIHLQQCAMRRMPMAGAAAAQKGPLVTVTLDPEDEVVSKNAQPLQRSDILISWDSAPDAMDSDAWSAWMASQLARKLAGMSAKTTRAQVVVRSVSNAAVTKGRVRAHNVDLELELDGSHLKQAEAKPVRGTIRVQLKTEDRKDRIQMGEVKWDTDAATANSPQVLTDITAAAQSPLESVLAIRLNEILWNVEARSLDASFEEETA